MSSVSGAPTELLALHLQVDAQRGVGRSLEAVRRGQLVVHALHGLGQVVGFDPPGAAEATVRVRFSGSTGVGEVYRHDLFAAE